MTELLHGLGRRRLVVCLDYDGTLTAIVARPELARLSADMRDALRHVAARWTTAVISGRGLSDVRALVGLEELVYAGNHGLEIEGPPGSGISRRMGEDYREAVQKAAGQLEKSLADIEGLLVEDKGYSLSVHYRLVDPAQVKRIEAAVDRTVADSSQLVKRHGKKVYELRPALEWDKGRALLWLLEVLDHRGRGTLPIYIGDDVTDEDAFRALEDRGIGILVSEAAQETAATYRLRDPAEVREFLEGIAEWKPD
jgi:alpha,alpha-trehalase